MNQNAALVDCDQCGNKVFRSKTVFDQGANYPKLMKKMKKEGKDHLVLCTDCAGIETSEDEKTMGKDVKDALPNVRNFL